MELIERNGLRILKAQDGYKLKRIDDINYSDSFYLGIKDSPDNFIEISNEEIEKQEKQNN